MMGFTGLVSVSKNLNVTPDLAFFSLLLNERDFHTIYNSYCTRYIFNYKQYRYTYKCHIKPDNSRWKKNFKF